MDPHKLLAKAIKSRSFDPVYYLHGDDDFLKEDAVKALCAAAVDPAMQDFNLEVRRAAELDAEALDVLLNTLPMMAERRAVVVRDVPSLKKEARAALDRYIARPAPDTVLVLVAPAGAKADKALLEKATALDFAPLTADRVPKWIAHHVGTKLGGSISPAAAELLHGAVGSDLAQLDAELDKLVSFAGGREITEADVGEVVGVRRGETLGDLLDAVAAGDARRALDLVPHVLLQPKTSGVSVVMALATQTLALAWARAMRDRGVPRAGIDFWGLLKESNAFTGRPWGEAVGAWQRWSDRWTVPQLERAVAILLDADVALKETRVSSEEQVLSSVVLAICALDAKGAAA